MFCCFNGFHYLDIVKKNIILTLALKNIETRYKQNIAVCLFIFCLLIILLIILFLCMRIVPIYSQIRKTKKYRKTSARLLREQDHAVQNISIQCILYIFSLNIYLKLEKQLYNDFLFISSDSSLKIIIKIEQYFFSKYNYKKTFFLTLVFTLKMKKTLWVDRFFFFLSKCFP